MSFWKIALAVGCGIVLAGLALAVACSVLVGTAVVENEQENQELLRQLRLTECEMEPANPGDWAEVRGTVKNDSDQPAVYVKVVVDLADAEGSVLDSDFTYVNTGDAIRPGARKAFEKPMRMPVGAKRFSCRVESARTE